MFLDIGILIIMGIVMFWAFVMPHWIAGGTVSGTYVGSQIWSGDILVTGDVKVLGDLTVQEGDRRAF